VSGLSELIFVCAIVGRIRASSSHNGVVFNQSIKLHVLVFNQSIKLSVIFVSHFLLCLIIKMIKMNMKTKKFSSISKVKSTH
jgi:hypothetical protein